MQLHRIVWLLQQLRGRLLTSMGCSNTVAACLVLKAYN
jgi:hypothetical protein